MALVNFNQSVTCNAQSKIDDKIVLYMNANIPQEGNISINKSIEDRELYFDNEEQCKLDFLEFNNKVEEIAKNLNN